MRPHLLPHRPRSRLPTLSNPLCYTSLPSNSAFFVVLLLAPGPRSFFSSPYVYYGHRRHCQFCSSFHVPCISILRFTSHTPHQASIRTHPSSSTHIYNHPFHVHISPIPCFFHHLNFSTSGEDDVLHRLISVSTIVGFPGWTFHRFPSKSVSLSFLLLSLQFWFIYSPLRPPLGRIRSKFLFGTFSV